DRPRQSDPPTHRREPPPPKHPCGVAPRSSHRIESWLAPWQSPFLRAILPLELVQEYREHALRPRKVSKCGFYPCISMGETENQCSIETKGKDMPPSKDKPSPPERPDILRGTLDMMILKVLTAGPAHGYEVMQRIARASDEVILLEEGSL